MRCAQGWGDEGLGWAWVGTWLWGGEGICYSLSGRAVLSRQARAPHFALGAPPSPPLLDCEAASSPAPSANPPPCPPQTLEDPIDKYLELEEAPPLPPFPALPPPLL